LIAPFDIFCQLDLQLGSESSTGNKLKRDQKKTIFRSVTVYYKHLSSQCNCLLKKNKWMIKLF